MKFYSKYGFFGIVLMIISILSIIFGIYITFKFLYIISNSVTIINKGGEIDTNLTGMIGDFMGGVVGTIWSFAGVILFFLALRLQSKELGLQIEELRSTREVFSTQQFENTFFNLLKTQNDIRQSVEHRIENFDSYGNVSSPTILNSHTAFEEIKKFMLEEKKKLTSNLEIMKKTYSRNGGLSKERKKKNIDGFLNYYTISYKDLKADELMGSKAIYKRTFEKFHNQLGHYFRNLYHILLYLKESEEQEINLITEEESRNKRLAIYINEKNIEIERIKKKYRKYANFVQAQMSATELLLLFYNCLYFNKMKRLVQYYKIIESLSLDDLLNPEVDNDNFKEYLFDDEKIPEIKLKNRNQTLQL